MENYIVGTCSLSMTPYIQIITSICYLSNLQLLLKLNICRVRLMLLIRFIWRLRASNNDCVPLFGRDFFLVVQKAMIYYRWIRFTLSLWICYLLETKVFRRETYKLRNLIFKNFRDLSFGKASKPVTTIMRASAKWGGLSIFVSDPSGIYAWLLIRHEMWALNVDNT